MHWLSRAEKEDRMKSTPISTTSIPTEEITPELQEAIRVRAYELYEQRGREDGHDIDDWLQAVNEVTTVRSKRMAA